MLDGNDPTGVEMLRSLDVAFGVNVVERQKAALRNQERRGGSGVDSVVPAEQETRAQSVFEDVCGGGKRV